MQLFMFQTRTVIPFTALIHHYSFDQAAELWHTYFPESVSVDSDQVIIPSIAVFSAGGFILQHPPPGNGAHSA